MRRLILILSLLLPALAQAQGFPHNIPPVYGSNGQPRPGATISFCTYPANAVPCTNYANAYNDIGLTQLINQATTPIKTDGLGNVQTFFAAAGIYAYTVSGTGITVPNGPYVISIAGGGGGGGSGTVLCAILNTLAKFTASTVAGCSSVIDDGTNPTRAPNGINSASGPLSDEWPVGPGGVLANHLACRVAVNAAQVQICPAGATLTVIGVAQTTQAQGNNVVIEYGAKANVCSTNNTAVNDWLIPSLTTPGCVDDTGSTIPPTAKTFTWPAESAAAGGTNVLITNSSLDTLIAAATGGNLPSCLLFSLIYESGPGTGATYSCINAANAPNGSVQGLFSKPSGGVATAWQVNQFGVVPRALAAGDSIGIPDIAPGIVECSLSSCTVTVPDIGATGFAQNPVFKAINGNGTLTVNNTSASKFRVANCFVSNLVTTFNLSAGQSAIFSKDADGTDWLVTTCSLPQSTLGAPTPIWANVSGSYSVPDSDQGWRLLDATPNAVITLGAPNSVGVSPIVAVRVNSGNISSSPFSPAPFSQSANNQLAFLIANDSGTPRSVSSITDSAGDTFVKQCEALSGGVTAVSIWVATGIAASGANTPVITWAANPGRAQVYGIELTGSAVDTANCSTGSLISTGIHFSNALALGIGFDGTPTGWLQQGNVNGSEADSQLQHNVASVTYGVNGTNPTAAIGVISLSISSTPTFVFGWNFTAVNTSNGVQSVVGTINGQANQVLFPNQACSFMVGGSGASPSYNSLCWFEPNAQANGIVNGSNTIYASDQTAGTSSITGTTIFTSASTPVSRYRLSGRGTVTVVGTSCVSNTTIVMNVIYTDPASAGGTTTLTLPVTFTIVNNGTVGVSSGSFGSLDFEAKGSTNIQFSTTYTAGGSCSPAPTVQVTPILQVL